MTTREDEPLGATEDPGPRAVEGGGPRPGRARCECHNLVHDRQGCHRIGSMLDGWFLCGPCKRHRKPVAE